VPKIIEKRGRFRIVEIRKGKLELSHHNVFKSSNFLTALSRFFKDNFA